MPRGTVIGSLLAAAAVIALGIFAATRLAAPSGHLIAGSNATPTAKPTATSAPTVVFTSDWTSGQGWQPAGHWSAQNGQLTNDGGALKAEPLLVPYTPTAQHYAIEFDAQILGMTQGRLCRQFALQAYAADGTLLYTAGTQCLGANNPYFGASNVFVQADTPADSFGTSDFVPGQDSRVYRVEVDGENVTFCISGGCLDTVTSARPITVAKLVLVDTGVQWVVSRFVVTRM